MLSARAIAMQGIGLTPRMVAAQGLLHTEHPATLGMVAHGSRTPKRKRRNRDDEEVLLFVLR